MKMMGMSNTSFYLSWYISYSINYTFISLVSSLILSGYIKFIKSLILTQ